MYNMVHNYVKTSHGLVPHSLQIGSVQSSFDGRFEKDDMSLEDHPTWYLIRSQSCYRILWNYIYILYHLSDKNIVNSFVVDNCLI